MRRLNILINFNSFPKSILLVSILILCWPSNTLAKKHTENGNMNSMCLFFVTEDDPPLSFEKNGQQYGLMIDIVQEINKRLGNPEKLRINILPWARAYRQAQTQSKMVLFNTVRTRDRNKFFKWVGPVIKVNSSIYLRKDSNIKIDSIAAIKNLSSITVVRNWYMQSMLKKNLKLTNIHVVSTPRQMIRMLLRHRTDAIIGEDITLPYQLNLLGSNADKIIKAKTFAYHYGYIAFSLDVRDDVVATWQAKLGEMKRDGTLARIHSKWLPVESLPYTTAH